MTSLLGKLGDAKTNSHGPETAVNLYARNQTLG